MRDDHAARLPPFAWDEPFARFFRERVAGASVEPTCLTRDFYLDLAERIARACLRYQRPDGLVLDPLSETDDDRATATPRLVAAIAPLVAAGRCLDLVEPAALTMDYATDRLARSSNVGRDLPGPEFYTRDLAIGWLWLRDHVEPGRAATWAERLSSFDPEHVYWQTSRTMEPEEMHNWVVYAMTGEYLKTRFGLRSSGSPADTSEFVERYLPYQLARFDENAMYRDPNCPILYDLTVRQGLSWMLHWGYDGPHRAAVSELLRRGGLMSLFAMSPTGQMPYGGRSNQYHHNEAMASCLFEFEAHRYARQGSAALAHAFKRAARLAARAVAPWVLDCDPPRAIKNRFPIDSAHGLDARDYYVVYALLAANLFGIAYHLADESIPEGPTPADLGGYVLSLSRDFHRAFAAAGGYHIELDLAAQQAHDATGLGRVHRRGLPTWLGLSTSIPGSPSFTVPTQDTQVAACLGPAWRAPDGTWHALAENSEDDRDCQLEVLREAPDATALRVTYRSCDGATSVVEEYFVSAGGVRVVSRVQSPTATRYRFVVPLLADDGAHQPELHAAPGVLSATCPPYRLTARCLDPARPETQLVGTLTSNRNGIYRLGVFETDRPEFTVLLTLDQQGV